MDLEHRFGVPVLNVATVEKHLELAMKKPSMQIGLGIALGAGIGAAVAVVLGTGGAWLAIGIAIGVVFGASMSKTKADSSPLEAVRNDKRFLG